MRQLVISEPHNGVVQIENNDGVKVQAPDIERAFVKMAHHYGIEPTELIRGTFDATQVLDTLMGQKRQGGHIHEGVLSG